jgi:hypothetical protein
MTLNGYSWVSGRVINATDPLGLQEVVSPPSITDIRDWDEILWSIIEYGAEQVAVNPVSPATPFWVRIITVAAGLYASYKTIEYLSGRLLDQIAPFISFWAPIIAQGILTPFLPLQIPQEVWDWWYDLQAPESIPPTEIPNPVTVVPRQTTTPAPSPQAAPAPEAPCLEEQVLSQRPNPRPIVMDFGVGQNFREVVNLYLAKTRQQHYRLVIVERRADDFAELIRMLLLALPGFGVQAVQLSPRHWRSTDLNLDIINADVATQTLPEIGFRRAIDMLSMFPHPASLNNINTNEFRLAILQHLEPQGAFYTATEDRSLVDARIYNPLCRPPSPYSPVLHNCRIGGLFRAELESGDNWYGVSLPSEQARFLGLNWQFEGESLQ